MSNEVLLAIIGGGFAAINAIITAIISGITQRRTVKAVKDSTQDERIKRLETAAQCGLRKDVVDAYEKYMPLGYCPLYAKEMLNKSYQIYHELGGNDVATRLYHELMGMPENERGKVDEE